MVEDIIAPFDTKVLLGAKYETSLLISLLDCSYSIELSFGPNI